MNRELEELVRQRAGDRCEYCRFPRVFAEFSFQFDHIISKKHHGETTGENLAFACIYCNRYKGPNISGIDPETSANSPLFHPRRDRWEEHFRWNGPELLGLTSIGRTTIDVLRINHPDAIAVRASLIDEGVFS